VLSALFNQAVESSARWSRPLPFWWRTTLAGLVVGLLALAVPEVMGIGYDTVKATLNGELLFQALLLILLAKVVATSACVGLGVPGGMIGPVLFMGTRLGGMAGIVSNQLLDGVESSPAFYALIGMGAMMGASLQAPLAALTAMMELTYSPGIIMPGMLAIVGASLVSNQLFRKESLFIAMLKANGMDYDASPVAQAMRRISVMSMMNRRFVRSPKSLSREEALALLTDKPDWLVLDGKDGPDVLMPAVDLARHLEDTDSDDQAVNLGEIPAQRYRLTPIHDRATLQEAFERLETQGAEAVYVEHATVPGVMRIHGILTRGRIESAYRL
jgi:CIC family chloride channel protein